MKKYLSLLASLCLAALLFTTVYAGSAPGAATDAAAKPTKQPGQGNNGQGNGHGQNGPGNSQGRARGGPCGRPGQAGADPGKTHYDGVLTGVGTSSLTIATTLSGTVTVDVTDATCIQRPPRKGLALSELAVGMRVGVLTVTGTGGNPVAVRVLVHKPRKATFVGTVTVYAPGASVTLQPQDGSGPLTFALTDSTEIKPWHRADELAVGSVVTLQAARDFVGGDAPALRIIVHGPDGDDD